MEALIALLLAYFGLYLIYILRLSMGFGRIADFNHGGLDADQKFSIVIPFRNESENLPALLESVKNLNYPKTHFEIILIDDFSSDDSVRKIFTWRLENGLFHTTMIDNVRVSGSPKKDAIMRAIPIAANPWIVTTDADCILPKSWLSVLNEFILQTNASMVAGPVSYLKSKTLSGKFQQADVLSLQGVTIGSFGLNQPFMCNGANFAYTRQLFLDLDGFKGNASVAGGDDVFLLQKALNNFPSKVGYLKSRDAIVKTQPAGSWGELIDQRVRWASKATKYQNDFGQILSLVALFGNVTVLILLALAIAGKLSWLIFAGLFAAKFLTDYTLMYRANRFLKQQKFLFPILSSIIYPFFTMAVAILALIGRFRWKGRSFRR